METSNQQEKRPCKAVKCFRGRMINPKLWLSRTVAGSPLGQIAVAAALFFFLCAGVWVYSCMGNVSYKRALVDMLSPVSLRNVAYGTPTVKEGAETMQLTVEEPQESLLSRMILFLLGTLVFSGIFIATVTNILRTWGDRFKNGEVTFCSFRKHIVILGYNDLVPGMIERMCGDDEELPERIRIVVGVPGNIQETYSQLTRTLSRRRRKRVVLLKADSNNEWDLKWRMRVKQAKEAYIFGDGDDAYSMNSYKKIQSLCGEKKELECYVEMQHQSTFALFQTYSRKDDENLKHFHAFNIHDVWARQMVMGTDKVLEGQENTLDTRKEERITPESKKRVHLVVIGMTEMGEALAREAAFLCHYPNYVTNGFRTRITFIDPQAEVQKEYFTGRYHHLFDLCKYIYRNAGDEPKYPERKKDFLDIEFEFINANVADEKMRKEIAGWANDEKEMLTIAVCTDMPYRSMAAGLYLPDEVFDNNIPVWVYQPTKGNMKDYLGHSHFKNVIIFGMSGKNLDIKNEEIIHQAQMLDYLYGKIYDTMRQNNGKSKEEILEAVDSLKLDYTMIDEEKWNNLDVFKKWSNVYCVSTIKKKIDSVRGQWNNENIKLIDTVEHNRWNVEKLMMGFRAATDYERKSEDRDNLKKRFIHCDIRPYSELDEVTKKFDNKFTKEIPNIIKPR